MAFTPANHAPELVRKRFHADRNREKASVPDFKFEAKKLTRHGLHIVNVATVRHTAGQVR